MFGATLVFALSCGVALCVLQCTDFCLLLPTVHTTHDTRPLGDAKRAHSSMCSQVQAVSLLALVKQGMYQQPGPSVLRFE